MKQVFITGANGFIGQALSRKLLSQGWRVVALAKDRHKARNTNIHWVFGDIRSKKWQSAVKGSRIFIHLAGIHGYVRLPFRERLAVEMEGCKKALSAAQKAKVKHFIIVSTAYTHSLTDYAKAKNIVKKYILNQINQKLPITIICPVAVYGPGQDLNLTRLYKAIKTNRFWYVGEGKNYWNLLYIDDLIEAIVLILENRAVYKKKLVVAGEKVQLNRLVQLISKIQGSRPPRIHLPVYPLMVSGKILKIISNFGIPVPYTSDTIMSLIMSQNYRTSHELNRLGYSPQVGLRQGLEKTLNGKN